MSSFPFVWIIISCCLNIASLLVYSAKLLPSIEAISPNLPYVATFDQTNCQLRSVEEPWIATGTVSSLEDRSRHLGWMWRELGTCLRDLAVSTNCVRHLDPLGLQITYEGYGVWFFAVQLVNCTGNHSHTLSAWTRLDLIDLYVCTTLIFISHAFYVRMLWYMIV